MNENEIAKEVVDAAIKIHKTLGPGLWKRLMKNVWHLNFVKED